MDETAEAKQSGMTGPGPHLLYTGVRARRAPDQLPAPPIPRMLQAHCALFLSLRTQQSSVLHPLNFSVLKIKHKLITWSVISLIEKRICITDFTVSRAIALKGYSCRDVGFFMKPRSLGCKSLLLLSATFQIFPPIKAWDTALITGRRDRKFCLVLTAT